MPKAVVAAYESEEIARAVIPALVEAGFRRDDISAVSADRRGDVVSRTGDSGEVGAVAEGAGLGALTGGLAGLVVGLAALAIPGLGPILAAGPIAGALAGAGLGAAAGGLIGVLVDTGVPEEEAAQYVEGIRKGGTLVIVHSPAEKATLAREVLDSFGKGRQQS